MEKVQEMQAEYAVAAGAAPAGPARCRGRVRDIRWMIEELRVSYFAHALGTAYPGLGQAHREGRGRGGP